MMRQPPPEFVPYNMINNNNNNNGNHEPHPQRHPPPPPGMVDVGPNNNPHLLHPIPIFSVNGAGIFPSQCRPQVNTNGPMMFMMHMPEPMGPACLTTPADFCRPFAPPLPSDLIPPSAHNLEETDFDEADTYGTPVNFVLCKERFNGIGDVRPFINAIIDFKNCSEMKDESALRSLSLLLTDQAAHWWHANKNWVTDWQSALKLLRNNYRPRTQQHRIYHRFFNAPQAEESTAAFVQRTKALLSKIPVNTLTPETQLDLIFAMLHRRIKDKVNRDDCDTLLDLMERARKVEESLAARATAPPQPPAPAKAPAPVEKQVLKEVQAPSEAPPLNLETAPPQEPELLQSPMSPQDTSQLEPSAQLEPPAPPEPLASSEPPLKSEPLATPAPPPSLASLPISDIGESSEPPCDHCKAYGLLFERTCRKLHNNKDDKSPQNIALLEELSKLDAEKFSKIVCFRCRSDNIVDLKCQKCVHEVAGGCPLISVTIYDVDFTFVVDTGSSHSVASSELMNHLIACGQEFAFNALIMPIRGIPRRHVFRVANVEMMVAGVPISTVLVDLPGAKKSVFGMDFIKQAGLSLDFSGEGTWTVRGGKGEQPILYERLSRVERHY